MVLKKPFDSFEHCNSNYGDVVAYMTMTTMLMMMMTMIILLMTLFLMMIIKIMIFVI